MARRNAWRVERWSSRMEPLQHNGILAERLPAPRRAHSAHPPNPVVTA